MLAVFKSLYKLSITIQIFISTTQIIYSVTQTHSLATNTQDFYLDKSTSAAKVSRSIINLLQLSIDTFMLSIEAEFESANTKYIASINYTIYKISDIYNSFSKIANIYLLL